MARKTLDDQLLSTQQEIRDTEEILVNLRQKEKDIQVQIDNRNMKEYYSFIKAHKLTMDDLESLIPSSEKNDSEQKSA